MPSRPAFAAMLKKRDEYRSSHASPDYGLIYDRTYERGYYAALWIKIEKPLVSRILRDLGGPEKTCLDFACGTGRVARVAADHFGKVVGVDVSASMLTRAQGSHNVQFRQIDITRQSLGNTFDVITAFRFFLNAEQQLRQEALQAMREHLRSEGRLICNIHMNAASPIGMASRIANLLPWSATRNTMSAEELRSLLASQGFMVERIVGYGYLPRPGRLLPRLCEVCVEPVEQIAAAVRLPARWAQQFLVIAKRREEEGQERSDIVLRAGGVGADCDSPARRSQFKPTDPFRKLRIAMALLIFGGLSGFILPMFLVGGIGGLIFAIAGLIAGTILGCAAALTAVRYL